MEHALIQSVLRVKELLVFFLRFGIGCFPASVDAGKQLTRSRTLFNYSDDISPLFPSSAVVVLDTPWFQTFFFLLWFISSVITVFLPSSSPYIPPNDLSCVLFSTQLSFAFLCCAHFMHVHLYFFFLILRFLLLELPHCCFLPFECARDCLFCEPFPLPVVTVLLPLLFRNVLSPLPLSFIAVLASTPLFFLF